MTKPNGRKYGKKQGNAPVELELKKRRAQEAGNQAFMSERLRYFDIVSYSGYEVEFSGSKLYQTAQWFDRVTDETEQLALINLVLHNLMMAGKGDKYDSTDLAAAKSLIILWAKLLIELRTQLTVLYYCPSLARSDTGGGQPFARTTLQSLIDAMESNEQFAVPGIAVAIANALCIPLQLAGAIPARGIPSIYFYPWSIGPNSAAGQGTYAYIDALLAVTETYGNAAVFMNVHKIPYFKFNRSMVMPLPPLSIISTQTPLYSHISICDAAGEHGSEINGETEISYFPHFGVGEVTELLALIRDVGETSKPGWWGAVSVMGAGYISCYKTASGDTARSTMEDGDRALDWLINVGVGAGRSSPLYPVADGVAGPMLMPILVAVDPVKSSGDWDQIAISYLTRHADGSPPSNKSLELLPDTVLRPLNLPAPGEQKYPVLKYQYSSKFKSESQPEKDL
jgi:hypothetical protein